MAVAVDLLDILVNGLTDSDRSRLECFVLEKLKPTEEFPMKSDEDLLIASDMWSSVGREDVSITLKNIVRFKGRGW
jgi:hypothetical protein